MSLAVSTPTWESRNGISYLSTMVTGSSSVASAAKTVLQKMYRGQAHELLQEPSTNAVLSQVMGEAANVFGHLKECSCPELNRIQHPKIRECYENVAIEKALHLATNSGVKILRIEMFASGYLFGESVLLVKLLKALEKKNWKGSIQINFSDPHYAPDNTLAISREKQGLEAAKTALYCLAGIGGIAAIGGGVALIGYKKKVVGTACLAGGALVTQVALLSLQFLQERLQALEVEADQLKNRVFHLKDSMAELAVKDFLGWLKAACPPSIQLDLKFFQSAEERLQAGGPQSDLLLGADFEKNRELADQLKARAVRKDGLRALLIKTKTGPHKIEPQLLS